MKYWSNKMYVPLPLCIPNTYMVKNPTEWSAVPAFQRHQRHNFLSNDEVRDKSRIDSHEETVWSTALPHVKMTSMDFINIRNDSTRKYTACIYVGF